LRVARSVIGAHGGALYSMVTGQAAAILRLPAGAGTICAGGPADLVALPDVRRAPSGALLAAAAPSLVIVAGAIKLISRDLIRRLRASARKGFSPRRGEGRPDVLVRADVPRLYARAARILGPEIRLAGRKVLV